MVSAHKPHDVIAEERPDGSMILRSAHGMEAPAARTLDWLDRWAEETPRSVFLAERSGPGWRELRYREARDRARAVAGSLLDRGIGPDRPVMVISGNGVDHGILSLASQMIGAPVVPVAEQYALVPEARKHLDDIGARVEPGLVFADDGEKFGPALERAVFDGAEKAASIRAGNWTTFESLEAGGGDISSAADRVGPRTVAKILFTSGSTSKPKGVLTTHGMMCANQEQVAAVLPFLAARPPVIVDWLPWNHVFGSSFNMNLILRHGGGMRIDAGKPTKPLIGATLENLRMVSGTLAFNVPAGFAMLRDAMRDDAKLREVYFRDLDMVMYAGASLPGDVFDDLLEMAREVKGEEPLVTSSWGLTETAPAHLLQHEPPDGSGRVGVPLPGAELKLVPVDGDNRWEAFARGPNVFGGYHRDPDGTAGAFDAGGWFRSGDAMRLVDPADPSRGLAFDGRLGEEFKLASGVWVRAAALRLDLLRRLGGLAADVVICGADRAEIGLLVFPGPEAGSTRADDRGGILVGVDLEAAVADSLAGQTGGPSRRAARALVMAAPPSMAEGEITAKGNLNFGKVRSLRAEIVERLYAGGPGVVEL